ncbi:MAG TPA: hypothetical protein VFT91_05835 [Dehalococcoidia bacterium]|nr:hypothetical protein [Dehalococcoidia bacterium]
MLRACWRVLRPGGRMAFYTIFIAEGLSERDYRRAARARGPGITSWRRQQSDLLRSAGFVEIEELDLTDEFLRVARAWLAARSRRAAELRQAEGAEEFEQRLRESRAGVRAIEAGLIRRALFVARRP